MSTPNGNASLNIIFAGTPLFAATTLSALLASSHRVCAVYTQPDRPAGRGRKLTASPVKTLALTHAIPVHQPLTLRDPEAQNTLRTLQADIMVVVAYGLLLPPPVLDAPRLGCINIHASLLPRWRGAAPIQRAILAGDTLTGITIIQMDAGLDTGDMLLKAPCPIHEHDTAQTLHDKLAALGAQTVLQALQQLADGSAQRTQQDPAQACYAAKLTKEEALLDWRRPAPELARQVRAFNPWPTARTLWEQNPLLIHAAHADSQSTTATPGTVLALAKEGIVVATGAGALTLTQLQRPGGRPQTATEFLNAAQHLRVGTIFGAG